MGLKKWLTEEKEHGQAWQCPKCGRVFLRQQSCCSHVDKKHGK